MIMEELDKKIEEARNHSEVLSQAEIDKLLKAIASGAEDLSSIRKSRKIKICDFKRPEKFSKQELRDISNVSKIYAKEIKSFLACEYDINAMVQIAAVDQLTFEEQVRSLPTPIPFCTFKWGEGAGMLSLDPALFYEGFFNHPIKKNRNPNGFEQKVFFNYIYKPFEKILYETYSKKLSLSKLYRLMSRVSRKLARKLRRTGVLVVTDTPFAVLRNRLYTLLPYNNKRMLMSLAADL